LISPKEALKTVLRLARPLRAVTIPLAEAQGFRLAVDIVADRDLPPTDRSAVDGFAMRTADLAAFSSRLRLAGEVAAGDAGRRRLAEGSCVRVFTGAVIPRGADAVAWQEDATGDGAFVTFRAAVPVGANIRRRGEEAKKGGLVLANGTRLSAARVGVCASVGKATVRVTGKPGVAVLSTGGELREAGRRVGPHQLRDSNGPALCAALAAAGYAKAKQRLVPDSANAIFAAIRAALVRHEVVLVTGGVSVGKYDFVPRAVERLGATVRFHGVAMKPGKPQLYATAGRGRHIFCLPGNPLSALVGFHEFVLPLLGRLAGCPPEECARRLVLPLAAPVRPARSGRSEYLLAALVWGAGSAPGGEGRGLSVRALESRGSADLVAGAAGDGVLAVPPAESEYPAGALMEFTPWKPLT
jgi:molybdopterin molybdotransferase